MKDSGFISCVLILFELAIPFSSFADDIGTLPENVVHPSALFPQSSYFDSHARRILKDLERQSAEKQERSLLRLQQVHRERQEVLRLCQCSSWDELIPIRKKSTFANQASVKRGWVDHETLESFQFSPEIEDFHPFQLQWNLQDSHAQLKEDFQNDLNSFESEEPLGLAQGYIEAVLRRVAADYFPQSRRPLKNLLDRMREAQQHAFSDNSFDEVKSIDSGTLVIQDVRFQSGWMDAKKMKLNISLLTELTYSNSSKNAFHEINIERQQCLKKTYDDCQNKTLLWISRKQGDSKVQVSYEINRKIPTENHADVLVQHDF